MSLFGHKSPEEMPPDQLRAIEDLVDDSDDPTHVPTEAELEAAGMSLEEYMAALALADQIVITTVDPKTIQN